MTNYKPIAEPQPANSNIPSHLFACSGGCGLLFVKRRNLKKGICMPCAYGLQRYDDMSHADHKEQR